MYGIYFDTGRATLQPESDPAPGQGRICIIGPKQEIINDVPIANGKAMAETFREDRATILEVQLGR